MRSAAAPVGTWMTGSDGRRWFFDSGSLALDFAYTGDFGYGNIQWESLHSPADLEAWLTSRFEEPDAPVSDQAFRRARELRAAVTFAARAIAGGSRPEPAHVDTINAHASAHAVGRILDGGTERPPAPTADQMLATLAQEAVVALSADSDRLRHCRADDCGLIFLDVSRPRSRRWCSMQRCGGRAKARAHYDRHRHEGE